MAQVKSDGTHLKPNFQYVCFLFCGNHSIFHQIQLVEYLVLKMKGQGHGQNWPKSNQVIYDSGPSILQNKKKYV